MITDLHLIQFKKFKSEPIELFPLTLLTGINGMGKSTVIQSLLVLRQSFDRGDLQNNGLLVIEDKLVNLVSPDDMLCADADNKIVSIKLSDGDNNSAKWSVISEGKVNSLPFKYEEKEGDIYKSALFADTFQYLNAERIGPRVSYDRLTVRRPHSPIGYRGEYTANRILETINDKVVLPRIINNKYSESIYDQLSAWVSDIIYPGTKVEIDGSDNSKIDIKYTFRDQPNKSINPINTGFGFSYALPVILAVLTAKPGSLIIVENPEAHLHPMGQSKMGMFLALAAECGVQIIAETHSDHILNGIRVIAKGTNDYGKINSEIVKVHFFKKQKDENGQELNKRSLSILPTGKMTGWPAGFFDEWENNLRTLIK